MPARPQRRDRLVICATALRRYLPEVLRVLLGLSGSWSCESQTAAVRRSAAVGTEDRRGVAEK